MSVDDLIKNSKDDLLEMCEKNNITCFKSWSKLKLAEALHAAKIGKKSKKSKISPGVVGKSNKSNKSSRKSSRKSSKTKSSKNSKKGSLKEGLSCDMDEKNCEKSSKYAKADIVELAIKCGVATTGSRKDICARIALHHQMQGGGGSKLEPDEEPDEESEEEPEEEPKEEPKEKISVQDLVKNNKQSALVDMCIKKKVICQKSWSKTKLAEAIYSANKKPSSRKTSRKPSSPKPSSPKPSSPKPSSPEGKKCYDGNTYEELIAKKSAELKILLEKAGVKSGRPISKTEMAGYLCDIAQNKRCDLENDIECDGDLVCDASNNPGVCVSPKFVNQKTTSMMWGGKKIIGTKIALVKLQKLLDMKKKELEQEPEQEPEQESEEPEEEIEEEIVYVPSKPSKPADGTKVKTPQKTTTPKPISSKPKDGEEVIESADIEEILRQIQQGKGEEIGELAATQAAVLKCLGLLA